MNGYPAGSVLLKFVYISLFECPFCENVKKFYNANIKKLVTKKKYYEKRKQFQKELLTYLGHKVFSAGTQSHIVHISCRI